MDIKVTYGSGKGPTEVAAFDAALWDAGIANYNLITLSSIIPPNSRIVIGKLNKNDKDIGDKLYVVLSKCIENKLYKNAYAGLGWAIREDGSGIFIEECEDNQENVKKRISNGLKSVINYRKGKFNFHYRIESIKCVDKPVCAIVAAVYKIEGW